MIILKPNYLYSDINKKYFWQLIILISVLFAIIIDNYIITEEHYYRTFSEQLSINQINRFFNLREKWAWVGYLLIPFSITIKLALVAMVLKTGAILSNINVSYKQFFHAALFAETVFVVAMLVKVIWLYFNSADTGLEYIQYFYPLSAFNFGELQPK